MEGEIGSGRHPARQRICALFYFLDAQQGWAAGERGALLSTNDGGAQWKPRSTGSDFSLHAIAFVGTQGWIAGEGDSSGTRRMVAPIGLRSDRTTRFWLETITFVDGRTGWRAGETGVHRAY
jgi:photosystem II stability/assembly factor-like uncharacterized protein